jgi:hypothetical protein
VIGGIAGADKCNYKKLPIERGLSRISQLYVLRKAGCLTLYTALKRVDRKNTYLGEAAILPPSTVNTQPVVLWDKASDIKA